MALELAQTLTEMSTRNISWLLLSERKMFQTKFVEKKHTFYVQ